MSSTKIDVEMYNGRGDQKFFITQQKVSKALLDPNELPATMTEEQKVEMQEPAYSNRFSIFQIMFLGKLLMEILQKSSQLNWRSCFSQNLY